MTLNTAFTTLLHSEWKKLGKHEEYKRYWDAISVTIQEGAAAHKIPGAEVCAAFNGSSHDEEPGDKGYIQPNGAHPNEAEARVIAKAFRHLGYVLSVP